MKTTIVMFSYRGEEEILPVSVGRVREVLPKASVHIYDDAKDPINEKLREYLAEDAAVHYHQTNFNRGGNLNGPASIKGQLKCMHSALAQDNNTKGWIAKMDPDTLLLRPGFVQEAFQNGMDSVMGTSEHGLFSGMFYACRAEMLDKINKLAQQMDLEEDAPEDLTIGSLIYMYSGKRKCRWVNGFMPEERKYFAAFDVRMIGSPDYNKEICFVARNGHIITVGNTGVTNIPKGMQTQVAYDLTRAVRALEKQQLVQQVQEAVRRTAGSVAPSGAPSAAPVLNSTAEEERVEASKTFDAVDDSEAKTSLALRNEDRQERARRVVQMWLEEPADNREHLMNMARQLNPTMYAVAMKEYEKRVQEYEKRLQETEKQVEAENGTSQKPADEEQKKPSAMEVLAKLLKDYEDTQEVYYLRKSIPDSWSSKVHTCAVALNDVFLYANAARMLLIQNTPEAQAGYLADLYWRGDFQNFRDVVALLYKYDESLLNDLYNILTRAADITEKYEEGEPLIFQQPAEELATIVTAIKNEQATSTSDSVLAAKISPEAVMEVLLKSKTPEERGEVLADYYWDACTTEFVTLLGVISSQHQEWLGEIESSLRAMTPAAGRENYYTEVADDLQAYIADSNTTCIPIPAESVTDIPDTPVGDAQYLQTVAIKNEEGQTEELIAVFTDDLKPEHFSEEKIEKNLVEN